MPCKLRQTDRQIDTVVSTENHNHMSRRIDEITIDELSLMAEEEIADRIGKCRSEMGKRMGDPEWRLAWEIELAYAQRELQIRHARRQAYREYLDAERAADLQFAREEISPPEYDGNRIPRFVREELGWS